MRHGETLYLGQDCPEGLDLTAEGRRQAEAAALALRGRAPVRLISSPYTRALETAHIIADVLGGIPIEVVHLDDRTAARWFNTGAFAPNTPGTWGDAPRGFLRGPAYWNVDLALYDVRFETDAGAPRQDRQRHSPCWRP